MDVARQLFGLIGAGGDGQDGSVQVPDEGGQQEWARGVGRGDHRAGLQKRANALVGKQI